MNILQVKKKKKKEKKKKKKKEKEKKTNLPSEIKVSTISFLWASNIEFVKGTPINEFLDTPKTAGVSPETQLIVPLVLRRKRTVGVHTTSTISAKRVWKEV